MTKRTALSLQFNYQVVKCGTSKDRSASWASASNPKNIEETRLGSIFLVGEIDPEGDDDVPPILPLIGAQLKEEYYAKPNRRALASFAESLRTSNNVFARVPKKRNPMWLGRVHMACGSFANGILHLSLIGKIRAYLFRSDTALDLARRFVADSRPHPTKLFRNIASGNLEKGDRLLFATPKIFTSLFLEDVRHIVREAAFAEISRQIELLYEQQESRTGVHMIIAEIGEGPGKENTDAVPATARPRLSRAAVSLPRLTLERIHVPVPGLPTAALKALGSRLLAGVSLLRPQAQTFHAYLERYWQRYASTPVAVFALALLLVLLLLIFQREVVL
ncbi:MAG: hypothetical protein Q8R13_02270 [bacterium]|nr:hypothetical protein [bacterium]